MSGWRDRSRAAAAVGQSGGVIDFPSTSLLPGTQPGEWRQIASLSSSSPTPVVMQVACASQGLSGVVGLPGEGVEAPVYVSPLAFNDAPMQGALRIRYGAGGMLQARIADIVSGSYQLPPCKTVVVDVRGYNRSAVGSLGFTVSVSLSQGSFGTRGRRLTMSGLLTFPGGLRPPEVFPFPQGAEFVRFGAQNNVIGSDVQFEIEGVQPVTRIDYSVPAWANQVPDLVPIQSLGTGATILKSGTDAVSAFASAVLSL